MLPDTDVREITVFQIYCCVGMLAITGRLHHINADLLGWWLCERQLPSGGLNGEKTTLHRHT